MQRLVAGRFTAWRGQRHGGIAVSTATSDANWIGRRCQVSDASPATLSFIAKLVAKSGSVDKAMVGRLLPKRMLDSLTTRHNGDLAVLVKNAGGPFGLAVNADGTKIISNGAGPTPEAKAAAAANVAPPPAAKPAVPPGQGAAKPAISAPKLPNLPGMGRTSRSAGGGASPAHGGPDAFNPGLRTWKSPAEVADSLMEYVPTFWIKARHVHNALPHDIKELYNERMRLNQFIRKFQFYFDTKVMADGPYLKVRDTCSHPKKGFADDRYASSLFENGDSSGRGGGSGGAKSGVAGRGIEQTTVEGRVRALVGRDWTPLSELESKLPPDVVSHKDYDKKAGLWALVDRFPQYFQLVDGNVRSRPIGVAPNALDERTVETSPEPEIFRRLYERVPQESVMGVPTATLFAELTAAEKALIKKSHRSFPRFLRMHGRVVSVTKDNMTVHRFSEELPDDVVSENAGGDGGPMDMLGAEPTEVVGKRLPGATSFDASPVETAIKDLFEALPLLQSVPLEDATFMLPASVREALKPVDLEAELREYPSYFSVWQFPDDPKVIVVQRANLDTPEIPADEIVHSVHPLVPQGGIDADRLMRKVPLPVQRYFYRHGLILTLKGLGQHFVVVGTKVLAIGE